MKGWAARPAVFCRPSGTWSSFLAYPGLTPWANICRRPAAAVGIALAVRFSSDADPTGGGTFLRFLQRWGFRRLTPIHALACRRVGWR